MYVYWWHVRGLRAVKVGHAEEPRQRVSDFRREYGLGGKDVRTCQLDSGTDARWVESQLCRLLEARGLHRIGLWLGEGEEELFALGGRTFEDVHHLLHDAARHIALAEVSNRRKQQRRREVSAVEVPTSRRQEPAPDRGHEEPRPRQRPPAAPSRSPGTARPWLYLVGALVVGGLATGLGVAGLTLEREPAVPTAQKEPAIAAPPRDVATTAGPPRHDSCRLVELSDTLVDVSCAGSWAWMRWRGRWVLDTGHDEGDAVEFFNASEVARRVVAPPSREPARRPAEQAEAKPAPLPRPDRPAAPPAPSPQLPPGPAARRPAALPPQPQPPQQPPQRQSQPQPRLQPQEPPPPQPHCAVSRPKPGYQVYLVTCPNSQVTIGRTVDVTAGWTISESVNGSEAIEFFMMSPYAR